VTLLPYIIFGLFVAWSVTIAVWRPLRYSTGVFAALILVGALAWVLLVLWWLR